MRTRLLTDGDIVAFVSAAAAQAICMDHDLVFPVASKRHGEALVDNMLLGLKAGLNADEQEVYLSDPEDNWRTQVDATYKTNRVGERPLLLTYLKEYLREAHGATHWAGLEADDTLSILGTEHQFNQSVDDGGPYNEEPLRVIIVGRDKDFKSIPGLHHAWKQDLDAKGNMLVREVTPYEADRFHLIQALAGDRIDGFGGCPGVGMTRAAAIIDAPVRLVPSEGVKTRGVNKGDSVTRWVAEPTKDYWACIVSHYHKAGLTEVDALKTARLARLLRYGEYDRETGEVTLWTPDKISIRR